MSLPTKEEWLDKWPEHEKGWTSRAIEAYPRDAMAALTAENAALRAEVERLRGLIRDFQLFSHIENCDICSEYQLCDDGKKLKGQKGSDV